MTSLEEKYKKEIHAKLMKQFGIKNPMAVPNLDKIVVNAGIGNEYKNNSAVVEEMSDVIAQITGQKPVVTYSKVAISNFKLREGMPNGVKVTLRSDMMWNFLNKLINITLPRVKDFRGVSPNSFDPMGNYTLGIVEHTIFPEIDTSKLAKIRSLQVVVVTTAKNKEQSKQLLKELGMPFRKSRQEIEEEKKKAKAKEVKAEK
ncbi:50S ribosomal protein L5 [Candidatus Dojkabacteria bacterium]|uniref:Large ribosomal subunit protein uL5 n=1 Tax=Candidatus Dojkabacteria bacterium TaxID=2099670 RepID=A0A955RM13_9BACT|nr:50S ribosomal protein L5 [Candidatus Dojkabacteria bacterium]